MGREGQTQVCLGLSPSSVLRDHSGNATKTITVQTQVNHVQDKHLTCTIFPALVFTAFQIIITTVGGATESLVKYRWGYNMVKCTPKHKLYLSNLEFKVPFHYWPLA